MRGVALRTSIRSFRADKQCKFIDYLLDNSLEKASGIRGQRIYRCSKPGRSNQEEQTRKENQISNQSQTVTIQKEVVPFPRSDQTQRERKVVRTSQGRIRVQSCQGTTGVSTNAIPRSAKTDRQTEYDVRSGEPASG